MSDICGGGGGWGREVEIKVMGCGLGGGFFNIFGFRI